MQLKRKNIIIYAVTALLFVLVLAGFIYASLHQTPQMNKPDSKYYEAKANALLQRFKADNSKVHAVLIDDCTLGETYYFDENGSLRKFKTDGSAVRFETDAEGAKKLAVTFCEAVSAQGISIDEHKNVSFTGVLTGFSPAKELNYSFDPDNMKIMIATDRGVFYKIYTPSQAETDEIFRQYRDIMELLRTGAYSEESLDEATEPPESVSTESTDKNTEAKAD